MAEGQGFEPWEPRGSPVFKTGAIDHSATPPKEAQIIHRFMPGTTVFSNSFSQSLGVSWVFD